MAGDSVTQVLYPEEGGPEIAVVKNQELLLRKKAHKKTRKIVFNEVAPSLEKKLRAG